MRILIVNKFLHHVGGVETYLQQLSRCLDDRGHEVHFFGMNPPAGQSVIPEAANRCTTSPNREFNQDPGKALVAGLNSVYSPTVEKRLNRVINEFKPQIVHFHATCRQLTPSVARATRTHKIPSVTTVHEYKPVCSSQRLWDDNTSEPCTACIGQSSARKRSLNIVRRRCVRGSLLASATAIAELPISDRLWAASRTIYHAPSQFMHDLIQNAPFIPNDVYYYDLPWGKPATYTPSSDAHQTAMYIGRLAPEKGVDTLLDAWRIVQEHNPHAKLVIAGSGDCEDGLIQQANRLGLLNVKFIGRYDRDRLADLLNGAAVTCHPSTWAENSPFTVRESLQHGVPAIVTDQGGLPEMVECETGRVIACKSPSELAEAISLELTDNRAGSRSLTQAVSKRAVSTERHMEDLERLYHAAESKWLP